jgi:hypothetical protein
VKGKNLDGATLYLLPSKSPGPQIYEFRSTSQKPRKITDTGSLRSETGNVLDANLHRPPKIFWFTTTCSAKGQKAK